MVAVQSQPITAKIQSVCSEIKRLPATSSVLLECSRGLELAHVSHCLNILLVCEYDDLTSPYAIVRRYQMEEGGEGVGKPTAGTYS